MRSTSLLAAAPNPHLSSAQGLRGDNPISNRAPGEAAITENRTARPTTLGARQQRSRMQDAGMAEEAGCPPFPCWRPCRSGLARHPP